MSGKVFFLTGCASGIGKHMTGALLKQGHKVAAADINLDGLEAAAIEQSWPEDRCLLLHLDVTDNENWEGAIAECEAELGEIDVLMNIAGYLQSGWLHEASVLEVNRHIDINAKGVVFGTQHAARRMIPRKEGHIINISSIAGLVPVPGMALYSAAKYFVRSYSLAASYELRDHGIAVTAVCPFSVATPLLFRQEQNTEASMMFAYRALSVQDIERALNRALAKRPLEVWIPQPRAWLARVIDVFPRLATWFAPVYNARGRAAQEKLRERAEVDR